MGSKRDIIQRHIDQLINSTTFSNQTMKPTTSLTKAILALAGVVLSYPSSHAGNAPLSFGDNDLMMGFRATAGTGAASNLMVNLNTADFYYNPGGTAVNPLSPITGGTITNIGRVSVLDISGSYSPTWASRTDLFWGIVGSSGGSGSSDSLYGTNTIYITRPETVAMTRTTAWPRANDYNNANVQISSMGNAGGYNGTSTANSNFDFVASSSNGQSYTSRSGGQAGQTFAAVNGTFVNDSTVARFGSGTYVSINDLFALDPSRTGEANGIYLGSFGLRNDGTIDYFVVPVPEPSAATYLLGACLVGAFRRRRSAVSATRCQAAG